MFLFRMVINRGREEKCLKSTLNMTVVSTILHTVSQKNSCQMDKNLGKPVPMPIKHLLTALFLFVGFGFGYAGNSVGESVIPSDFQSVAQFGNMVEGLATASDIGLGQAPGQAPGSVSVGYESLYLTLAIMVGVLLLVVLLLIFISANMVNLIRIREGHEPFSFMKTLQVTKQYALNPYIATLGNFVVIIIAMFIAVPILRGVGLSEGYKPDQPIWFSHVIHAKTYEIDCQFCHTGASKGKNAWIPSVNVCMNCHKAITEGTLTGTSEISKIHFAYENNMPINWVRVHSLPDLAYFNHQQHVVAGKQECETCHGDIKEMDVVEQVSPLSMGWCLNCHRETEVDADLYEKLGRKDVHTVEDIGGLSCSRCHY
ncbi:MAG TPA: cytochrome C [Bacteroidetes bacterium]|nr:cytochrome C [Bacteroidota bacterium]